MTTPPLPLEPLAYHREVVAHLRTREPELWAMFASAETEATYLESLRTALLRSTYRLEADAHPEVFGPAARAAAALDLDLPLSVFHAEGGTSPNATLVFVPDELIVVLSGALLALLDADELAGVFGHELAHHRLWTAVDSDFLTADRLLHAAADDPRAGPSHIATCRRYALATELFADRGSFLATGELAPAVAGLVKVSTGMATVNGEAYLRQTRVVVADGPAVTTGTTHPETFVRVHALDQWSHRLDTTAAWDLIEGPLDVDDLDLLGQARLDRYTQVVIADLIQPDWFRTDAVLGHAGQFSSGSSGSSGSAAAPNGSAADFAESTRRYLGYVLLDFATVDPGLDGAGLLDAFAQARRLGIATDFEVLAASELGLKPATVQRLRHEGTERAATLAASTASTDASTGEP